MIRIYKILLAFVLVMLPVLVHAQELVAYHVVGKVTCVAQSGNKEVVMNTRLTGATTVSIPYGGKLELLDETNKKRITLKKPGKGTIKALAAQEENSVLSLSAKYVAYVKKQLSNKGLTSKQRYTDFATVTRELDSVATAKPKKQTAFAAQFDMFKNDSKKTIEDFRTKCNKEYNDFVRQSWDLFGAEPPKLLPVVPRVEPVICSDTTSTEKFLFFGRSKKNNDATKVAKAAKGRKAERPKPVLEIKPRDLTALEKEYATMPFIFFGNELEVHLDETKRINLNGVDPNNVADILERLATPDYDNLLYDCLKMRDDMHMCDWAYLLMLKEIAETFCGEGTNEATVLLGYLYYQSGYKMRFAADKERLFLLIASKHIIYDKACYVVDGEQFYPIDKIDVPVNICRASFPKEQGLSLFISEPQEFLTYEQEDRTIQSRRYKDFGFNVTTKRSLMDFYDNYPASCINEDFTTRWAIIAETPLDEDIKKQIYPVLKEKLSGLSEYAAVNRLLNLVQTGLEYGYDDEIWGYDRAFFAEETMHYPFCDCEDRSVLFTRLVRDLLGLECVLVYYPGHLAAAVHFTTETKGDYYELNGKDYVVCDPTYINSDVGQEMPTMTGREATLIPIK